MVIRSIGFLVLISVFFSCKKEKTSWDTTWSAPLISDSLTLSNLVNDSTLSIENGAYKLDLRRTLFEVDLTEIIEIPDTTILESFSTPVNVTASPGFNIVNSVEEHEMNFKDVQLKMVILDEGFIDVVINNPFPTITLFNVKLPGVTKNGITFNQDYAVPPMINGVEGLSEESISLSGYSIDLTGVSGGDFNYIKSQITAKTDPNGPTVQLTTQDVIDVYATFRDVKINYARGYFGNQAFSDTTELNIDALSKLSAGTIDIPNTYLKLTFENGLKVAGRGELISAFNTNWNNNQVDLTHPQIGIPFNLDPAIGTWDNFNPGKKVIEIKSGNSNIEQYIENLGRKHAFGFKMEINPWGNTSGSFDEIFSDSRLSIVLNAEIPLNISLDGLAIRDSFDLNLANVTENFGLRKGEFNLEVENAFPYDGEVKMYFLNAHDQIIDSIVGSDKIQSGQFGTMNFNGLMTANSTVNFVISDKLANNLEYIKRVVVFAELNTIDASTGLVAQLAIPEGAFFKFKLKARFTSINSF